MAPASPSLSSATAYHPMTQDMGEGWVRCARGRGGARPGPVIGGHAGGGRSCVRRGAAAGGLDRRRTYLSGWVQQGGTSVHGVRGYMVKLFRDRVFYRFVFPRLADTMWYNCGDLITHRNKKGQNRSAMYGKPTTKKLGSIFHRSSL